MGKNAPLSRIVAGTIRFTLLGVFAAGFAARASGTAFIVEDGTPKASIVIAETPTRMQKLAAEELQKYVKKITGAELPIGSKPSGELPMTVYIGASDATRKLGVTTDDLAYGAYRITSGDDYLALVGRDDDYFMDTPVSDGVFSAGHKDGERAAEAWREAHGEMWSTPFSASFKGYNRDLGVWAVDEHGSLNAVNDFLRSLGVRWYMPGDFGEICPTMSSIQVPQIDETVRPEWSQREIAFHSANPYQISGMEMLWQLRLGLRPQQESIGGHGTMFLLGPEWVKQHKPEFFALYGGERATKGQGKPCYSSPGLFDSALGFSSLLFDTYGKTISSLMPTDGYTAFCQCALCKGKDTPERGFQGMMSDYVWGFMNRAAAESAKTHPNADIMNYAYNTYLLPPTTIERFHPNLRVGICMGRHAFNDPEKKAASLRIREGFLEKIPAGKIHLWEYYNTRAGYPSYYPHIIAEDLKWLKGRIHGTMIEYTRGKRISADDPAPDKKLAVSHLNLWLTTRLWWNPDAQDMWWTKGRDAAALLDEYYQNFYGPAAVEMKTFVEFSEENRDDMQTSSEPIDRAFELLGLARRAAGEDSIYAERVQLVVDYLEPLHLVREQLMVGRSDNPVAQFTDLDQLPQFKLDGKLDEAFWSELETHELKHIVTGERTEPATTFKLAWAGDSLYVAIRCEEPAMDTLHIPAASDGDNTIFEGDEIEILLETPTHAYYQIAIDPRGHVNDLDRPNSILIGKTGRYETKWEAGIDVAAFQGKDFWSVEAKIPALGSTQEDILPFFGVSGDRPTPDAPWYFNIGRIRVVDLPERQITSFSPTGEEGFHYMRKFARLIPK